MFVLQINECNKVLHWQSLCLTNTYGHSQCNTLLCSYLTRDRTDSDFTDWHHMGLLDSQCWYQQRTYPSPDPTQTSCLSTVDKKLAGADKQWLWNWRNLPGPTLRVIQSGDQMSLRMRTFHTFPPLHQVTFHTSTLFIDWSLTLSNKALNECH